MHPSAGSDSTGNITPLKPTMLMTLGLQNTARWRAWRRRAGRDTALKITSDGTRHGVMAHAMLHNHMCNVHNNVALAKCAEC